MKNITEVKKIECTFKLVCPKKWDELEPHRDGVKYCDTCYSNVYLCSTQEEVDKARNLGRCIAIEQVTGFITTGVPMGSSLPESMVDELLSEADKLYASRVRKTKD